MRSALLLALATGAIATLVSCSKVEAPATAAREAPWVKTVALQKDGDTALALSGTVRARQEAPVAFQVGGRILKRHVDAGARVASGAPLFTLDPRDLEQAVRSAEAQLAAAEAASSTAKSELERQRGLAAQGFISAQALERFVLADRDAASRKEAAEASAVQARNAKGYGELRAERDGVIVDVLAEAGQVVSPGQPLARLAASGEPEVEVLLPDGPRAPKAGTATLPGGVSLPITLREVAGAAEPDSRAWRARYRFAKGATDVGLGTVVAVRLVPHTLPDATYLVPLAAVDERAGGARLWQVADGKAKSVPAEVVSLGAEKARVKASLAPDARVIALGTHLLTEGMAVRERSP